MRLKKVKDASNVINDSSYVIKDYKQYIGNWKNVFLNDHEISLEIGIGKGDFIIGMALKYPGENFIGVEKYDSVLLRAIQKQEKLKLNNVRFILMDADEIDTVFEKEISTLYLNFSDPWPKKRHAKRRLTSNRFLEKYENIFKGTKKIVQKTDNIYLFGYSVQSLSCFGYVLKMVTMDLYSDDIKDNVPTEYETKFVKNNVKICKLEAYKD